MYVSTNLGNQLTQNKSCTDDKMVYSHMSYTYTQLIYSNIIDFNNMVHSKEMDKPIDQEIKLHLQINQ